jgi:hypothetical protein
MYGLHRRMLACVCACDMPFCACQTKCIQRKRNCGAIPAFLKEFFGPAYYGATGATGVSQTPHAIPDPHHDLCASFVPQTLHTGYFRDHHMQRFESADSTAAPCRHPTRLLRAPAWQGSAARAPSVYRTPVPLVLTDRCVRLVYTCFAVCNVHLVLSTTITHHLFCGGSVYHNLEQACVSAGRQQPPSTQHRVCARSWHESTA